MGIHGIIGLKNKVYLNGLINRFIFRKCNVIILPHDVAYVGMLFINNLPSEGDLVLFMMEHNYII